MVSATYIGKQLFLNFFFLNWQFLSMIGLRDFQILSAKIPDIFKMWHGIQLMVFETPVLWVALL